MGELRQLFSRRARSEQISRSEAVSQLGSTSRPTATTGDKIDPQMTTRGRRKKEEAKDEEYLITYTRHLEKRLRNLETENQLLNAERLRLEQELNSLRNEIDRYKKT